MKVQPFPRKTLSSANFPPYSGAAERSLGGISAAAPRQNRVIPTGAAEPQFLRPLARLLQRLLPPLRGGSDRSFGRRRYLWLLKRHHQRRYQLRGHRRLNPSLAQLDVSSPLEELPLAKTMLAALLQHRGPG